MLCFSCRDSGLTFVLKGGQMSRRQNICSPRRQGHCYWDWGGTDRRHTREMGCCSALHRLRLYFACSRLPLYELWYSWFYLVTYIVLAFDSVIIMTLCCILCVQNTHVVCGFMLLRLWLNRAVPPVDTYSSRVVVPTPLVLVPISSHSNVPSISLPSDDTVDNVCCV